MWYWSIRTKLNLFLKLPILPGIMIHVNLHSKAYICNCSESEMITQSINGMGTTTIWYIANCWRNIEWKLNQQNCLVTHIECKRKKKRKKNLCAPMLIKQYVSLPIPTCMEAFCSLVPCCTCLCQWDLMIWSYWYADTDGHPHLSAPLFSLSASLEPETALHCGGYQGEHWPIVKDGCNLCNTTHKDIYVHVCRQK